MYKVFNTRAKLLLCFFCSWNLLFVAFFTLLSLKQKHKQLVVGFPVLSPRKFGWLCMLIFCRGRWDAQIVKRTRRAFSLLVKYFVLSRSRRRRRHGLLRSCCDHNRAIDLRPSGIFRISILSRCDETVILFPTRNWTNVKSFKLETEFQQVRKNDKTTSLLYFPRFRLS